MRGIKDENLGQQKKKTTTTSTVDTIPIPTILLVLVTTYSLVL